MNQPQPPKPAAPLDLAIKPVRVLAAQGKSGHEAVRNPRVVVATFY